MWMAASRRRHEERTLIRAIFCAFLSHLNPAAFPAMDLVMSLIEEFSGDCQQGPLDDDRCVHTAQFLRAVADLTTSGAEGVIVDLLVLLSTACAQGCRCMQDLAIDIFGALTEHIDNAIVDGAFEVDPLSLAPALADKKRRRIDEDFRRAVATESVRRGAANTGRAMLRVMRGLHPCLASRWEVDELLAYQAAARRTIGSAGGHTSVASDAARLGDPPEETLLCLIWSCSMDLAAVAPPQVAIGAYPRASGRMTAIS